MRYALTVAVACVAFAIGQQSSVQETKAGAASDRAPTKVHRQFDKEALAKVQNWLVAFHTGPWADRARTEKELTAALDELDKDPALAPAKTWVHDHKSDVYYIGAWGWGSYTDDRVDPSLRQTARTAKRYQEIREKISEGKRSWVPHDLGWLHEFAAIGE